MLIKEFKNYFLSELSSIFPKTEIDTFFFLLVEYYLGFERIDTVLKPNFKISEDTLLCLKKALKRLQKEEPIQYILGTTEFYGLPFKVTKNTLIPRPETEELVAWILSEIKEKKRKNKDITFSKNQKPITILDIGTGTGCIAISLAKQLPNTTIFAMDVSAKALEVAKENAIINNVDIHFIKQDILQTQHLLTQYDIIVSNPPYVRELEKTEIKNNVLKNEPHIALFVANDNPLIFYSKITDLAKKHLSKNGCLFFEINQYLATETIDMLTKKEFTHIKLRKDLFGNNRMIKALLT